SGGGMNGGLRLTAVRRTVQLHALNDRDGFCPQRDFRLFVFHLLSPPFALIAFPHRPEIGSFGRPILLYGKMPGRSGGRTTPARLSLIGLVGSRSVDRILRLAAVGRTASLRSLDHIHSIRCYRDLRLFVFHQFSPPSLAGFS